MSSDFPVPDSLILQLANAPTPIFFNSYALDALPQLHGSMSYVTSSLPLPNVSARHLRSASPIRNRMS